MAEFIDTNRNFFLEDPLATVKTPAGILTTRDRKANLATSTGMTKEEIDMMTDESGRPTSPLAYGNLSTQNIAAKFEDGAELGVLEEQAQKDSIIRTQAMRQEMLSAVDVHNATDDRVSAKFLKTQQRLEMLKSVLVDELEKSNGGILDTVGEIVDQIAYGTYAGIRDIKQGFMGEGTETGADSDRIQQALVSLDDEQFKEFIQEYKAEVGSRGLGENIGGVSGWAWAQALQSADGAGIIVNDKEWGYASSAFAALDVATLGLAGASKLKSVVGQVRNSAGSSAAIKAAESTDLILRRGLDGELVDDVLKIPNISDPSKYNPSALFTGKVKNIDVVEEAQLVDDIIPEMMASTLKAKEAPPVSAAALNKKWSENFFLRKFIDIENKNYFGASYIAENSADWAADYARKLAAASSTRLAGAGFPKITNEGLQNYKFVADFGRATDGKPFKTFESAQKVLARFPNAVIYDARTGKTVTSGGKGEYYIRAEERIAYSDVAKPMSLQNPEAKTAVGRVMDAIHQSTPVRFFSGAYFKSSSYLSNLADSAEYGGLGYIKTIENQFDKVAKLAGKDLEAVNNILTTLRDAPTKGSPKSWLSHDEFIRAFALAEGKPPTLDVVEAYETLVELSDFSWFVTAKDRLRAMASQKASIVEINGIRNVVYPTEKTVKSLKDSKVLTWVTDLNTGQRVSADKLADDLPLMAFGHRQRDFSDYVVNFAGKTKLPELSDAFPYNAGGPRPNPDIRYFVGDTSNGWSTLIGTRTNKEAEATVKQFNIISQEVKRILGDEELTADSLTTLSKADKDRLNSVIQANNDWNPAIEDIADFFTETLSRGVRPNKQIFSRSRDARLTTFVTEGVSDRHLLDMSLEKYVSYSRHDLALREFGGELTTNPDPIVSITNQFSNSISRAAQTQYRMEATASWVKALETAAKNGDIDAPDFGLRPMTDEAKVYNTVIKGNKPAAKALRREQDVILRRLNMYDGALPSIKQTVDYMADTSLEAIRDLAIKKTSRKKGAKDVAKKEDTFSHFEKIIGRPLDGGSSVLTSFGFYSKMATPDQLILQAAHVTSLALISPVNAGAASVLAAVLRQAARSGNESVWKVVSGRLAKTVGLDQKKYNALLDHILFSGRGYMRGAVAEDVVNGFGPKGFLSTVGSIVRVPFYAGENYAATANRITAWLDIAKDFPDLAYDSKEFLNKVVARDRSISFGMNSAQRSLAQSGSISRVATQWTSYLTRAFETVAFGDLTGPEKIRLTAGQALLWGFGGVGLYGTGAALSENMPDWARDYIVKGLGDTLLSDTLGIQLGSRVGFDYVSLMLRAKDTLPWIGSGETVVPAFEIMNGSASSALSVLVNSVQGNWSYAQHDLETLIRALKLVDSGYLAYEMYMYDTRTKASGSKVEGPFTNIQAALQAVGFTPDKVLELGDINNIAFDLSQEKAKMLKAVQPKFKRAVDLLDKGEYAAAEQMIAEIGIHVNSLPESQRRDLWSKLEASVEGFSYNTMKTLIEAGYLGTAEILGEK